MTTLVEQQTATDCGICCLAMFFDATAAYVDGFVRLSHREELATKGMSYEMYVDLLNDIGLEGMYEVRYYGYQWGTYKFFKNMLWGRRAICAVRSKNHEQSYHFVYWDGHQVYDPSTKEKYTQEDWDSNLEPFRAYIFDETAFQGGPIG